MEIISVTDAKPVIHRQHDESAARQILIERVGVGVIVRVVPSQQHLSRRTTVYEHDRGFPVSAAWRLEQLSVNGQPIGGPKYDLAWSDEAGREVRRDVVRGHRP